MIFQTILVPVVVKFVTVHMIMIENAVPLKNLVDSIKETAMRTMNAKETLFVEEIIVLGLFQEEQTAVLIPELINLPIPDSTNPQIPESPNPQFPESPIP